MSSRQFALLARAHRDRERTLDRRTALVAAVMANTVPRKKGSKWATVSDFMPKRRAAKSPDELLAAVESLNAQLGGTDQRRR